MPKVIIDTQLCKGCGLCTDACPRSLIIIGKETNSQGYFTAQYIDKSSECTGCALCAQMCPDIAIEVFK